MRNDSGWNLPPGCYVSDIPGNRPEDEKWEAMLNGFWDKKRSESKSKILADANTDLTELIDEAIEYGIDVGVYESQQSYEENKGYENLWKEETRNPKLRQFFRQQRELIRKLQSEPSA